MRRKDRYDDLADELIHCDRPVRRASLANDDGELAFALGDALHAKLEADARALWAYRVIERHALESGSYSLGYLPRHEALLHERATALVAAHPELDPDAPRGAPEGCTDYNEETGFCSRQDCPSCGTTTNDSP